MRTPLRWALCVLLAACGAAPDVSSTWFRDAGRVHRDRPPAVPAAADVLSGFDAPGEARVDPGDRILYALRLVTRRGERTVLVHVQAEPAAAVDKVMQLELTVNSDERVRFESEIRRLQVTLYDAAGARIEETTAEVPTEFLNSGLHAACEHYDGIRDRFDRDGPASLTADDRELFARSFASLVGLVKILEQNETLFPLLEEVLDLPSVFSVIWHFGVHLSVEFPFDRAERWTSSLDTPWDVPAWRTPLLLTVNDNPALHASFVVVEPRSPLVLGHGIVSAIGFRPSDPDTRFELSVLAARRAR